MRLDGEAKERLIRWIQKRMDEFGIEVSDLGEIETEAAVANVPARMLYRDAQGNGWDGNGEVPEWLQRYINAGQAMDHFRVSPSETTE
jgi:DNA-binding protein H-NS